jgi:hypothetical protein
VLLNYSSYAASAEGKVSTLAVNVPLFDSVALSGVSGWTAPVYHAVMDLAIDPATCTVPAQAGTQGSSPRHLLFACHVGWVTHGRSIHIRRAFVDASQCSSCPCLTSIFTRSQKLGDYCSAGLTDLSTFGPSCRWCQQLHRYSQQHRECHPAGSHYHGPNYSLRRQVGSRRSCQLHSHTPP